MLDARVFEIWYDAWATTPRRTFTALVHAAMDWGNFAPLSRLLCWRDDPECLFAGMLMDVARAVRSYKHRARTCPHCGALCATPEDDICQACFNQGKPGSYRGRS
jgi:hypothetical protein